MFADCMAHPDTFIKLVYYWPHSMSSPPYHVVIIAVISSIQ